MSDEIKLVFYSYGLFLATTLIVCGLWGNFWHGVEIGGCIGIIFGLLLLSVVKRLFPNV